MNVGNVSPRVRMPVDTEYASAYAGGRTSWLRIESQLQHLEDLVDLPGMEEDEGVVSTVVVKSRR